MCNPNASKCQISSSTRPSSGGLGAVVQVSGLPTNVWVPKCQQVLSTKLPAPRQDPTKQHYGFPQMLPCSHPAFFLHVPDIAIIRCNLPPTPVLSCQCHQYHSLTVGPDNIHCPLTQTTKYRTIVFGVSNFQGQGHAGSNDPAPQLQ